jgi:hypothetical protein
MELVNLVKPPRPQGEVYRNTFLNMNICTKNLTRRGVKDFKVQSSKLKVQSSNFEKGGT